VPFERDRPLLQQECAGDPWKVFAACILLTQTQRKQVDEVWDKVMLYWPSPEIMAEASLAEVAGVLTSNGLSWVKAYRLIRMSHEYLSWDGEDDPTTIFGVGEYGRDAYAIFVSGALEFEPRDKELAAFLESLPYRCVNDTDGDGDCPNCGPGRRPQTVDFIPICKRRYIPDGQ